MKKNKKWSKFLYCSNIIAIPLLIGPLITVGCSYSPTTCNIEIESGTHLLGYELFEGNSSSILQFIFNGQAVDQSKTSTVIWSIILPDSQTNDSVPIWIENCIIHWGNLNYGEYNFIVQGQYHNDTNNKNYIATLDFSLSIQKTKLSIINKTTESLITLFRLNGKVEPFELLLNDSIHIQNEREDVEWSITSVDEGISIDQYSGKISWSNTLPLGEHRFDVKATLELSQDVFITAIYNDMKLIVLDKKDYEKVMVKIANDNYSVVTKDKVKEIVSDIDIWYSDSLFSLPASTYNAALMSLSMSAAFASMPAISDENKEWANDKLIRNFYQSIGFQDEDIKTNDVYQGTISTFYNTIGLCCGLKQLDDGKTTLIALTPRSGNYGGEWGGNFIVGKENPGNHYFHEGFGIAVNTALGFLTKNISYWKRNNKIRNNVKFWFSGFSRGAATVNLLGGLLDIAIHNNEKPCSDWPDGIQLYKDNIFVYCGETPAGASCSNPEYTDPHSNEFSNIFSLINVNDLVTYVCPSVWNFTIFGSQIFCPFKFLKNDKNDTSWNENESLFLSQLSYFPSHFDWNDANDWHGKDMRGNDLDDEHMGLMPAFTLINFFNIIAKDYISRDYYVDKYQESLSNLFFALYETGSINYLEAISAFISMFSSIALSSAMAKQCLQTLGYQASKALTNHSIAFALSWVRASCPLYLSNSEQDKLVQLHSNIRFDFIYTYGHNWVKVVDITQQPSDEPIFIEGEWGWIGPNTIVYRYDENFGVSYYDQYYLDEGTSIYFPYTTKHEYEISYAGSLKKSIDNGLFYVFEYDAETRELITLIQTKYSTGDVDDKHYYTLITDF